MKILLSSFGSSGDYNPFLALGRALMQSGHEVVFLSNPYYEQLITDAGMRFLPAGEYIDLFDLLKREPKFLDQKKGPKALLNELVIPLLRDMHPAAMEVIRNEKIDLVISHFLEMGSIFAAIKTSVTYCTLTTTPSVWMSVHQPVCYGHYELPSWAQSTVIRIVRPLFKQVLQLKLSSVCRELDVPPKYASWQTLFSKAFLNLGAWSPLFRPAVADDPPNSCICGFFRDEHVMQWQDIPPEVEKLLEKARKPIVVGMGSTAAIHGHKIYDNIIPACKQLDRPLLLVGPDLEQYDDQANNILTIPFAPFGWLFPKAHVVVHHGGVNTTGETLRAGVPGIVVPFSYDQFDNAFRVEKMHAGKKLKLKKLNPSIFNEAITSIDSDSNIHDRLAKISSELITEENGAQKAVQLIEEKLSRL